MQDFRAFSLECPKTKSFWMQFSWRLWHQSESVSSNCYLSLINPRRKMFTSMLCSELTHTSWESIEVTQLHIRMGNYLQQCRPRVYLNAFDSLFRGLAIPPDRSWIWSDIGRPSLSWLNEEIKFCWSRKGSVCVFFQIVARSKGIKAFVVGGNEVSRHYKHYTTFSSL